MSQRPGSTTPRRSPYQFARQHRFPENDQRNRPWTVPRTRRDALREQSAFGAVLEPRIDDRHEKYHARWHRISACCRYFWHFVSDPHFKCNIYCASPSHVYLRVAKKKRVSRMYTSSSEILFIFAGLFAHKSALNKYLSLLA